MGKVIIDTSVASSVQSQVLDFSVEEDQGNQFFYYPIHKTGFYCVKAWPVMVNQKETIYEGHIRFNNHHGALAGSDYPKLPVSLSEWGFYDIMLIRWHARSNLLPIAFFLSTFIVLWSFVTDLCRHRNCVDGPVCKALARDLDRPALYLWSDLLLDGRDGVQLGILGELQRIWRAM